MLILTLSFALTRLAPGVPLATETSLDLAASPKSARAWEQLQGLHQPWYLQYIAWMSQVARGNLGRSFVDERPVGAHIREALPKTLVVTGAATVLAYLCGGLFALWSTLQGASARAQALALGSSALVSLPTFLLAMLLALGLATTRGSAWFPLQGLGEAGASLGQRLWHLVLPVTSLTLPMAGRVAQVWRSALVSAQAQPYFDAARGRGLSMRRAVWRYAWPNSVGAMMALLSLDLPAILGGSVAVEFVFGIPGMGELMLNAVLRRDYPIVMGGTLVVAVATVLSLLVFDLLARAWDPRLR